MFYSGYTIASSRSSREKLIDARDSVSVSGRITGTMHRISGYGLRQSVVWLSVACAISEQFVDPSGLMNLPDRQGGRSQRALGGLFGPDSRRPGEGQGQGELRMRTADFQVPVMVRIGLVRRRCAVQFSLDGASRLPCGRARPG